MPARDLHDKPFDDGTKTKLTIYRSYIRAWLQVFLHATPYSRQPFQFFDFFCGPGHDPEGALGSPLILIDELLRERPLIEAGGHEIRIFFNDMDNGKIRKLESLCAERNLPWAIRFESLDFQDALRKVRNEFDAGPSLVFIDQNGVKHITKAVFKVLTQAGTTDFLFFTASSFKLRFGKLLAPEIEFPEHVSYLEVHRELADRYREWAPKNVFIGHFSIKKGSNIYGLILGSHHWRGLQKFLEIVWKLDEQCGEADYELEQDTEQAMIDFDQGTVTFKKRKVELFTDKLLDLISGGNLESDGAVFLCCLVNGFLPRIAKDVYIRLRQDGIIKNAKTVFPRCSADAMKNPRKLEL